MGKDRGRLTITINGGEWVRLTTPGGETIWVGIGRTSMGKAALMFNADKAVRIIRDELLPSAERFAATEGARD